MTGPLEVTSSPFESRPRMSLDKSDHIIEYVGGPNPYYWIGSAIGEFFGAVNASALRKFVMAPNKWQEPEEMDE
jgi:hypothetical protein